MIGYLFTRGKLYSGQVFIDSEANFLKAKEQLTKLYGNPDFKNDSTRIYHWKWPKEKITVPLSESNC